MNKQGTVVRWDDARGFGFIRRTGAQDIFFHVRDFRAGPDRSRLPRWKRPCSSSTAS